MEQLGHTDPKFTLRVYAHAMRFSEEDRARLKAFAERRSFGTNWHWHPSDRSLRSLAFQVGAAGFEPATSRV